MMEAPDAFVAGLCELAARPVPAKGWRVVLLGRDSEEYLCRLKNGLSIRLFFTETAFAFAVYGPKWVEHDVRIDVSFVNGLNRDWQDYLLGAVRGLADVDPSRWTLARAA